jgi:hypothetical protein
MLKISNEQADILGERIYLERMRRYLYSVFPESKRESKEELNQIIGKLTQRAKTHYGLILETDIAPFIVGAWLMGVDFDKQFLSVKNILTNHHLSSIEKSESLWKFLEESFKVLESK